MELSSSFYGLFRSFAAAVSGEKYSSVIQVKTTMVDGGLSVGRSGVVENAASANLVSPHTLF
jgi:hypothetical protein